MDFSPPRTAQRYKPHFCPRFPSRRGATTSGLFLLLARPLADFRRCSLPPDSSSQPRGDHAPPSSFLLLLQTRTDEGFFSGGLPSFPLPDTATNFSPCRNSSIGGTHLRSLSWEQVRAFFPSSPRGGTRPSGLSFAVAVLSFSPLKHPPPLSLRRTSWSNFSTDDLEKSLKEGLSFSLQLPHRERPFRAHPRLRALSFSLREMVGSSSCLFFPTSLTPRSAPFLSRIPFSPPDPGGDASPSTKQ